jgi:outer membrane protein OmpA-like peptidoglycan-associated protein
LLIGIILISPSSKVSKLEKKEEPKQEVKVKQKEKKPKGYQPLLTQARIHFEFNKAKIKKEYMPYLNVISKYLKAHPNLKVKIVGYTDNIGSENYNKKLSLKRAEAVKNALVKFGISPKRIEILGKGKKDFLFDNKNELNRFTNRRVDFFILETK